jgi:hypothetical protein
VKLDFFREEFGKSLKLLKIIDLYDLLHGKKQIKKEKVTIHVEVLEKYCISETAKMYKFDDEHMDAMLAELCSQIPDQDIPLQTRLQAELEYLGYISFTDPSRPNSAAVMDINCKYTPKITLYKFYDGSTITVKYKKKSYEQTPLAVGNIVNFSIETKPGWKKDENGEWQVDYSKTDTWMTRCIIESYN